MLRILERINESKPRFGLFAGICWAVLLSIASSVQSGQLSPVGPIPAEAQRSGDPAAGYAALVDTAYVTCGAPYQAWRRVAPEVDPSAVLANRSAANHELPYSLTRHRTAEGVELVVSNCLACHAGYFNGELIVGLGNETLDWTEDISVAAETVGAYVQGDADAAQWRKWADRLATIAPYVMTETVGVNPANNLTFALIAHRDPETLAWSNEPLLEPPPERPLPVSVPPWWRMQKKHALFYSGEGRGDHARFMMTAAILCTDSVDEARAIDRYAPDIRAYLASLRAPRFPFAIDRELAAEGKATFQQRCSGCHGHYGSDPSYPNLLVPLEVVGTDPALAEQAVAGDRFVGWYNRSFFGEMARAAPALGYVAPPLDGVWATAPYLHNGSVPTIDVLLDSSERPRYWRRVSLDSKDYDSATLGWRYRELDQGKDPTADWDDSKHIYDTTLPGYSNSGHTFGDMLSATERQAVLEYLKTL